jgi:hypothetical protein
MNGKKDSRLKTFSYKPLQLYDYLLRDHSKKTASEFLDRLQQRVELIIHYPEIGKPSIKKTTVRSVTLQPHNRIYYRLTINKIELLCLFDMRKKKQLY